MAVTVRPKEADPDPDLPPWSIGLNFRRTADHVVDGPGEHALIDGGYVYPIDVGNNVVVGWENSGIPPLHNAADPVDRRFGGTHKSFSDPGFRVGFRITLPGPGEYDIALALWGATERPYHYPNCYIYDGPDGSPRNLLHSVVLLHPDPQGEVLDASGVLHATPAAWLANGGDEPVRITTTTGELYLYAENHGTWGTLELAHIHIAAIGGEAPDERTGHTVTRLSLSTTAGATTERRGATTTGLTLDSSAAATTERRGKTATEITVESQSAGQTVRRGSTTTAATVASASAGATERRGSTTTGLAVATDSEATTERTGSTTTSLGVDAEGPGTTTRAGQTRTDLTARSTTAGIAHRIGATLTRLRLRSISRGKPGDVDERLGWSITRLLVRSRSAGSSERRSSTTTHLELATDSEATTERQGSTTTQVRVRSTAAALVERVGRSLTRLIARSRSHGGEPVPIPYPRPEHIARAGAVRRVAVAQDVSRTASAQRVRRTAG